jgi:hypothetical protein
MPGQAGSLFWSEGDTTPKLVTIPIINNDKVQASPGEEFYVELYGQPLVLKGNSMRMRITVTDDDQLGFLRLDTTSLDTRSDQGSVPVLISRVFGSASPVAADYYTVAGTAKAGLNYQHTQGTLVWRHGETDQKTIVLPLINSTVDARLSVSFELHVAYVTGASPAHPPVSVVLRSACPLPLVFIRWRAQALRCWTTSTWPISA